MLSKSAVILACRFSHSWRHQRSILAKSMKPMYRSEALPVMFSGSMESAIGAPNTFLRYNSSIACFTVSPAFSSVTETSKGN
ncbi:unnamed protein product [Linum trigynum]|uniref:Uncharacterized protein n=1 Tax=Linum trigynum TaxID=586398 RepID=A0AAV2EG25_9ROSI